MTAEIAQGLTYFLALVLALCFHEAAHALLAKVRGDRTAEQEGRLTLNPVAHADPIGTVVLPLVGIFAQVPLIGWAKPVPVDLRNLKSPRWDGLMIALAGPFSNLIFAAICVFLLAVYSAYGAQSLPEDHVFYPFITLLQALVWVNTFLAFFNLIPLPPLDGAAMVTALLPTRLGDKYDELVRPYGFFILLMIVISGGLHWLPKVAGVYVGLLNVLVTQLLP